MFHLIKYSLGVCYMVHLLKETIFFPQCLKNSYINAIIVSNWVHPFSRVLFHYVNLVLTEIPSQIDQMPLDVYNCF